MNATPYSRNGRQLPLVVALGVSLLACQGDQLTTDGALGVVSEALVAGQIDRGDPAVVAIVYGGDQSYCSGTLIAPREVVTAAHCLPQNLKDLDANYNDISVFFGNDLSGEGIQLAVTGGWQHPSWSPSGAYDDIAMLRLAAAAPVAPMPLNDRSVSANKLVRLVGFGVTGKNLDNQGIKRTGTAFVEQVDAQALLLNALPSVTCYGDSGGATFAYVDGREVLVGVHARADCEGVAFEMRIDHYLPDIEAFISGTPTATCQADGQCAGDCASVDPDCSCAADGFCTDSCPTPALDPDCSAACAADNICELACATIDPDCTCLADGFCNEACGDDPDCAALIRCKADGNCDQTCLSEGTCWIAGEVDAPEETTAQAGCRAGHGRGNTGPGMGWPALLLLGLASRLRSRARSRAARR